MTAIGILAGLCTTSASIPQVMKALKTRHTRDISFLMYLILCTGILLWFIYGVLLRNPPLIIANGISLLLTGTVLVLKIRYG